MLVVLYIVLKIFHKRIETWCQKHFKHAETLYSIGISLVAALCIPAGFLLVEFPFNTRLFEMNPYFVGVGLMIMAVIFLFVYSIGQRTKTSMMVYLLLCFLLGIANYYVAEFKSQPIFPSDLLALQTAAEVSTQYVYTLSNRVLAGIIILEVFACALAFFPRQKVTLKGAIANTALAALVAIVSVTWFNTVDIEEDYNCNISAWSNLKSFNEKGMLLCFMEYAQKMSLEAPENYSSEEAEALLSGTSTLYDDVAVSSEDLAEAAEAVDVDVTPTVIVIMNESFADISNFSAIDDSYEGLTNFNSISEESLFYGNAYVSTFGGNTCNSEFEFLTGASMGYLGSGVYPYLFYNLVGVNNLADYMSSLGYSTTAIHPAVATNWRRDRLYEQFGFDQFLDITYFENAEYGRGGYVTDKSTYDCVLDLLEENDEPQFIFDVTIANHGGYTTGDYENSEYYVHADFNGETDAEIDEYLSCVNRSDIEFAQFIEELSDLEQPVIVCMFGDHQSSLVEEIAVSSEGVELSEMTIEQAQQCYATPYLIWTNCDELKEIYGTSNEKDLSLNYLAANLLKISGLPLNDYFAYTLAIEDVIPAINISGYMDSNYQWHSFDEESSSSLAVEQLEIVQYSMLTTHENRTSELNDSS